MPPTNRDLLMALVRATENPDAPTIVAVTHAALADLGELMVAGPGVDTDKVHAIGNRLLAIFTPEEINTLTITPEMIVALTAMLNTSIEGYLYKLLEGPSPPTVDNKR